MEADSSEQESVSEQEWNSTCVYEDSSQFVNQNVTNQPYSEHDYFSDNHSLESSSSKSRELGFSNTFSERAHLESNISPSTSCGFSDNQPIFNSSSSNNSERSYFHKDEPFGDSDGEETFSNSEISRRVSIGEESLDRTVLVELDSSVDQTFLSDSEIQFNDDVGYSDNSVIELNQCVDSSTESLQMLSGNKSATEPGSDPHSEDYLEALNECTSDQDNIFLTPENIIDSDSNSKPNSINNNLDSQEFNSHDPDTVDLDEECSNQSQFDNEILDADNELNSGFNNGNFAENDSNHVQHEDGDMVSDEEVDEPIQEDDYNNYLDSELEHSSGSNMSSWESDSNISIESEIDNPIIGSKTDGKKSDASTSCSELNDNYHQIRNIFQTLNQDRKEGKLCDLVIIVEGEKFNVHKGILKAQSPYFEIMFTGPFIESNAACITLNELSSDSFQFVLEYLYGTETQSILTSDNLCNIAMTADMLCIEPLVDKCKRYLLENWKSIDIFDCYRLAKHLSMKNMLDIIIGEPVMCKLAKESTQTLEQLFFDFKNSTKNDIHMLKILKYLIESTPKMSVELASKFLPHIFLERIPDQYIDRFLKDIKKVISINESLKLNIMIENVLRVGHQKVFMLNLQVLGLEQEGSSLHVQIFDFHHWKWRDTPVSFKLVSKLTDTDPLVDEKGLKLFGKSFGHEAKNKLNLTETEIFATIPNHVLSPLADYFLLDVTMVSQDEFVFLSLEEFLGGWSYIVLNRAYKSNDNDSTTILRASSFSVERLCALPHYCTVTFLKNKEYIRSLLTVIGYPENSSSKV